MCVCTRKGRSLIGPGCVVPQANPVSGTHHLNTVVLVKTAHTLFSLLQSESMIFSAVILGG